MKLNKFARLTALALSAAAALSAFSAVYDVTALDGALRVKKDKKSAFSQKALGEPVELTLSRAENGKYRLTYIGADGESHTLGLGKSADFVLHGDIDALNIDASLADAAVTIASDARVGEVGKEKEESGGAYSVPAQAAAFVPDTRPYYDSDKATEKTTAQPYYLNGCWYFPAQTPSYGTQVENLNDGFVKYYYSGTPSAYITVTPLSLNIEEGHIGRAYARVSTDANKYDPVWFSSNPSVATVDSDGTITGVLPGTAVITATVGAFGGSSCYVRVTASEDD